MGDHKVRMKSIKPITNLSLRSIKLIFFNWVHKHLIQKKIHFLVCILIMMLMIMVQPVYLEFRMKI